MGAALAGMALPAALECAEAASTLVDRHPVAMGLLLEGVARHPGCAAELATLSEAETRCAQKWYKIALHALRGSGEEDLADAMWHRAASFRPVPEQPAARILWPSPLEVPTVWLSGLRSSHVWDCDSWPFVRHLEAASGQILREVRRAAARFAAAYPYLSHRGTWQDMFLYRRRKWNATLCAAMPATCRLLLPELPTKPGVPPVTPNHEEVVIFRTEPGAFVGAHSGSTNAAINLHLTLVGAGGTTLRVGDREIQLEDGRAVCFQDSYLHSIDHASRSGSERISLVVRAMHPDLSLASYGGAARTDVADLATWDTTSELLREAERLRSEYRRLAAEASAAAPGGAPAHPAGPLELCERGGGHSAPAAAPGGPLE